MSPAGLRFSPALQRLLDRTAVLLKSNRMADPTFADADAVSCYVAAIGMEIDAVYAELEAVRRELREARDRDHTPDIDIAWSDPTPETP